MKEEWFIQKISSNKFLKPRPKAKVDRAIEWTASVQFGRSAQTLFRFKFSTSWLRPDPWAVPDVWALLLQTLTGGVSLIEFSFCFSFDSTLNFDWFLFLEHVDVAQIWSSLNLELWLSGMFERPCNVWPLCSSACSWTAHSWTAQVPVYTFGTSCGQL